MSANYKILGQVSPQQETESILYTCPQGNQSAISTISVCNRGATDETFRIAVKPALIATAPENYVIYDDTVSANKTSFIKIGLTLEQSNTIEVYASSSDFSFSAFGIEVSGNV